MTNQSQLLASFLDNWPVERVQQMTINEYTNLNKSDSFCYWLEARTQDLGSIWGGSAFKFGIYEKNQKDKNYHDAGRLSDDDYAWMSKYGDSKETAFAQIKQLIIQIIDATSKNDLKTVENIDLGDAYKWKIAFLYSDYKILNVFNKIKLVEIAKELNLEYDKSFSFAKLQSMILHTKDEKQDFFEFGKKVWDLTKSKLNKKYWLYSPGEQAYKWEEFFASGMMALGWDELGDLGSYESRNDISKALYNSYGGKENKPNDTTANDEFGNAMNIGDVVIVKKGLHQLLGYGIVESEYYLDESRDDYKHCRKVNWIKKGSWSSNHTLVLKTLTEVTNFNSPADKKQKYYEYLLNIMDNKTVHSNNFLDILKYKKQIILQGPPGTGKTRLGKQIAKELIGENNQINVKNYLNKGMKIPNASGNLDYYTIENITESAIELSSQRATQKWTASFAKIMEKIKQLQKNEVPKNKGGNDPYELAVAKFTYDLYKVSGSQSQLKLIQFHPSYTYEDFVRGIVAKPNPAGEGIFFEAENKTLGLFAKEALKNYQLSSEKISSTNIDIWVNENFENFKNEIEKEVEEKEIELSGNISLFKVENDNFRYGKDWATPARINFVDFKKLIVAIVENQLTLTSQQISKNLSVHAHYRYTYYNALLKKFFNSYTYKGESYSEPLKNYVLIIDEINRANLSSVLGELIYALEYRGEEVESMYEVDSSQKLILPPNLYIIGTMNTADRSVGHIDYAIRRRFAFVEVLPKDLSIDMEAGQFYTNLFTAVKSLFTSDDYKTKSDFISQEFEPKDVALGHSYFIDKSEQGGDEKIRWEYEIKPILIEYVRDGVLKQSALQKISEIEESL